MKPFLHPIPFFQKLLICIAIYFLPTSSLWAQNNLTPEQVDTKTYNLYVLQKWSELITVGKIAIDKGYDYFYLRMRIGTAYYNKKNYNLAQIHFKEALEFNSKNDLAKEYLYYCYLFNGKKEEARKLSRSFSKFLSSKTGTLKASNVDFITTETALKIADKDYYDINNTTYFNTAFYAQIGLKHSVKNNFSLFHAATYFSQELNTGKVKQSQYYLQGAIPLKNNWLLSPAFHLVRLNFVGATGLEEFSGNHNYFVGSFQAKKSIKNIDFSLGTTYSNINNANQFNHFSSITYTPFGNSNLVLGYTGYLHTVESAENYSFSNKTFLYFQPTKLTSIKLSYFKNEDYNIIEDNGFLINNSYDLTDNRFEILADFKISKNASIYTLYQSEKKQHRIDSFNYNYNLFLIGLKIQL